MSPFDLSVYLVLLSTRSSLSTSHSTYQVWLPTLSAGGDDGNRTHDPLLAGQVLSQLSYTPILLYEVFECTFFDCTLASPPYRRFWLSALPTGHSKLNNNERPYRTCCARTFSRRLFWFCLFPNTTRQQLRCYKSRSP